MDPLLLSLFALLGAMASDSSERPKGALNRFPEYRGRSDEWLIAEDARLEDLRAGVGYGPKPVNWVPRSVSNPEIIERQSAIKTVRGRQLWQHPWARVHGVSDIPRRKHRELVARALQRGETVPKEVLAEYPDLWVPSAQISRVRAHGNAFAVDLDFMGTVLVARDDIEDILVEACHTKRQLEAQGKTEGYVGGDVGGEFTVDEAAALVIANEAELVDPELGDFLVVKFKSP